MDSAREKQDEHAGDESGHRVPVVLHHGFMGFGDVGVGPIKWSYYAGSIPSMIRSRGHPVVQARVHPTASVARRAGQLKQVVLGALARHPGRSRVVVVAHSMGGLDARHMITHLGMGDRVAALVTICTPHRGSPIADFCGRHVGRLGGYRLLRMIGLDIDAAEDLTTEACARFNERTPDDPAVRYFSISGARPWWRISPAFYAPSRIVEAMEGENDGVVSVRSSRWGRHLGVWPADHLHCINKRLVVESAVDRTGDVTPRYGAMFDELDGAGLTDCRRVAS